MSAICAIRPFIGPVRKAAMGSFDALATPSKKNCFFCITDLHFAGSENPFPADAQETSGPESAVPSNFRVAGFEIALKSPPTEPAKFE